MREMNKINFYIINETKNTKLGMLLFIDKPLLEIGLKRFHNLRMIKFFVIKQTQINRVTMAKTECQRSSSHQ